MVCGVWVWKFVSLEEELEVSGALCDGKDVGESQVRTISYQ
jgi:hypothetical protein